MINTLHRMNIEYWSIIYGQEVVQRERPHQRNCENGIRMMKLNGPNLNEIIQTNFKKSPWVGK